MAAVMGSQRIMISPERQLDLLYRPFAKPAVDRMLHLPALKGMPKELVDLIGLYAVAPRSELNRWIRVLRRLELVPRQVPRLPKEIHEVLKSCPIPCSLYFLPPGTLNEFIARVTDYGKSRPAKDQEEKSLRVGYFGDSAQKEYGDRFSDAEWILIAENPLPEQTEQTYEKKLKMIQALRKKTSQNWQPASLTHVVPACFFDEVLKKRNCRNKPTYVKETVPGCRLVVLNPDRSGLGIAGFSDRIPVRVFGITPVLKL